MDYQKLKDEIMARPDFVGLSDNTVADILNDPAMQTTIRPRLITARTILAELPNGAEILDKLESVATQVSAVKWSMFYLKGESGIDIGHAGTIAQIDGLVAGGVLESNEGEALKNMALLPTSRADILGLGTISYNDVNRARAIG